MGDGHGPVCESPFHGAVFVHGGYGEFVGFDVVAVAAQRL